MSTQEKLDRYEQAVKDWNWKVKAWESNDGLLFDRPVEPEMEHYGLRYGLEIWAAIKVKSAALNAPVPANPF